MYQLVPLLVRLDSLLVLAPELPVQDKGDGIPYVPSHEKGPQGPQRSHDRKLFTFGDFEGDGPDGQSCHRCSLPHRHDCRVQRRRGQP